MNFSPELARKVMAGEKTVTRRATSTNERSPWWFEKCSLVVGRDYAVCPGRGKNAIGRIEILSVRLERLALALVTPEPYLEGFQLANGFRRVWESMHGTFDPDELVWRVQFKVVDDA